MQVMLRYKDEKSDKFWCAETAGSDQVILATAFGQIKSLDEEMKLYLSWHFNLSDVWRDYIVCKGLTEKKRHIVSR